MVIYIAGRVTARDRLSVMREAVRARGYTVSSTWLDVAHDYPAAFEQTGEAERDLHEIDAAELLILDTIDESPTGGREFEAGYFFKRCSSFWVVGPYRHIFHGLASRFDSWDQVLGTLEGAA